MKKFFIAFVLSMPFAFADLASSLQEAPLSLNNLHIHGRALALELSDALRNPETLRLLQKQLQESKQPSVHLVPFLQDVTKHNRDVEHLLSSVANMDRSIRDIKGITRYLQDILQVRLTHPEKPLENFLIAYIPGGEETSWKSIEAFDLHGNTYHLDVHQAPEQQVLVVEVDEKQDLQAGLKILNEKLRTANLQSNLPVSRNLQVGKLSFIRLEDDKEPWVKGDAEIYALVNGIAPSATRPEITAEEMPYLDKDEKDYRPNQVIVVWGNYRYKAANIVLYEHDTNTNYNEIAAKLIEKIGEILPDFKFITELASQIIRLMAGEWWSDDDDYVDSFYTMENKTYSNLKGAADNARITLEPYTIPE